MSANKRYIDRMMLAGLSMIKTGQWAWDMGLGDGSECHDLHDDMASIWLLYEKAVCRTAHEPHTFLTGGEASAIVETHQS